MTLQVHITIPIFTKMGEFQTTSVFGNVRSFQPSIVLKKCIIKQSLKLFMF